MARKKTSKYTGPETYRVTTSHPTGYRNGTHELVAKRNPIVFGAFGVQLNPETWYVDGGAAGFGCSRDYACDCGPEAIEKFLAEHAMSVVKIKRVKS